MTPGESAIKRAEDLLASIRELGEAARQESFHHVHGALLAAEDHARNTLAALLAARERFHRG